jgi:hypothetical protein
VKRPRSKNDDNEKWLNEVELTGESVPKDVVVGEGKPDHEGILVLAGCNQGRARVIVNPRLTSNRSFASTAFACPPFYTYTSRRARRSVRLPLLLVNL